MKMNTNIKSGLKILVVGAVITLSGCAAAVKQTQSDKLRLLTTVNASCDLEKVEMNDNSIRIRCFKPIVEEF